MLHVSQDGRTVGSGKGGLTDKILYGTDSKHVLPFPPKRHPPSLQDSVMQALVGHYIRIILVDQSQLIGTLIWYAEGKFGLTEQFQQPLSTIIMSCNRICSVAPIEVDEEAVSFLVDNLKNHLLTMEERCSRIQGIKRRVRERNKRIAAASKFTNSK